MIKLYEHFSHMVSEYLNDISMIGIPWEVSTETRKAFEIDEKQCGTCRRFSYALIQHKVSVLNCDDSAVKEKLSEKLNILNSDPTLYFLDTAADFCALAFIRSDALFSRSWRQYQTVICANMTRNRSKLLQSPEICSTLSIYIWSSKKMKRS